MDQEKMPLVVLTGPTAVGKTRLSVELAQRINGEIISADSMQVYRGMDIGSAKVTLEERKGIPHYLIDEFDPDKVLPKDKTDTKGVKKPMLCKVYDASDSKTQKIPY